MATTRKCNNCGRYTSGSTNPCDICNPKVKIKVIEEGKDYVLYKRIK